MVLLLSELLAAKMPLMTIREMDPIAFRHSTYLNVLQHENRIRENQQKDLLPEQHTPIFER